MIPLLKCFKSWKGGNTDTGRQFQRDERKRYVLADPCIRSLDRRGVSKRRKAIAPRPREEGKACNQLVPKSNEHEKTIKGRKKSAARFKWKRIVGKSRRTD